MRAPTLIILAKSVPATLQQHADLCSCAIACMALGAAASGAHAAPLAVAACGVGAAATLGLTISGRRWRHARVERLQRQLSEVAQGNLRIDGVAATGMDPISQLERQWQDTVGQLSTMVADIRNAAVLVADTGWRLAQGTGELAARTEQQAASLEQTSASVAELSDTVRGNAHTAQAVDRLASGARETAESGSTVMDASVETMRAIASEARLVQDIISLIDGLAFQTNILALNAAVEAARAGEQGRGFAVVASEVRTLAQRSAGAAKEIRALIEQSSRQIETGVQHIGQVHEKLARILVSVREVAANTRDISVASDGQSSSLHEVSSALQALDEITQRNGVMVEQARNTAGELQRRTSELSGAVRAFQLRQGVAEEAQALVRRAVALYKQKGPACFDTISRDLQRQFSDRDMYVFAYDTRGLYLCAGGKPERVGVDIRTLTGLDGAQLLKDTFDGSTEPRWVDYRLTNPVTGKVEGKSSYLENIGPETVMGCGIYKSLGTQD
ncbi:MAG: methyl-accepting chemotaxis protein [Gammaproteobacteria bacterium]